MDYALKLSKEFSAKKEYIENIIKLLDDGNTIPFIARYRKEMHGSMDDQLIREVAEKLEYMRSLDKRREEIRALIEATGHLTDEISSMLNKAESLSELEDIYRPYKPKRRTRASDAREKGLQPLADYIMAQEDECAYPIDLALQYVNEEKGVNTPEDALKGALDIIAETVSDNPEIRKRLRNIIWLNGFLTSSIVLAAEYDSG